MPNPKNLSPESLTNFASQLLTSAGLPYDKATTVARLLVLTDMMQRHTHGVALCPLYIDPCLSGCHRHPLDVVGLDLTA